MGRALNRRQADKVAEVQNNFTYVSPERAQAFASENDPRNAGMWRKIAGAQKLGNLRDATMPNAEQQRFMGMGMQMAAAGVMQRANLVPGNLEVRGMQIPTTTPTFKMKPETPGSDIGMVMDLAGKKPDTAPDVTQGGPQVKLAQMQGPRAFQL